jgi:Aminoglycoside-2''-adenylyltransferase
MLVGIGFDYADLWRWEDFDPSRLSSLMCSFHAPWWVVGGKALELWMGRQTCVHQDVDVAFLRDDQ